MFILAEISNFLPIFLAALAYKITAEKNKNAFALPGFFYAKEDFYAQCMVLCSLSFFYYSFIKIAALFNLTPSWAVSLLFISLVAGILGVVLHASYALFVSAFSFVKGCLVFWCGDSLSLFTFSGSLVNTTHYPAYFFLALFCAAGFYWAGKILASQPSLLAVSSVFQFFGLITLFFAARKFSLIKNCFLFCNASFKSDKGPLLSLLAESSSIQLCCIVIGVAVIVLAVYGVMKKSIETQECFLYCAFLGLVTLFLLQPDFFCGTNSFLIAPGFVWFFAFAASIFSLFLHFALQKNLNLFVLTNLVLMGIIGLFCDNIGQEPLLLSIGFLLLSSLGFALAPLFERYEYANLARFYKIGAATVWLGFAAFFALPEGMQLIQRTQELVVSTQWQLLLAPFVGLCGCIFAAILWGIFSRAFRPAHYAFIALPFAMIGYFFIARLFPFTQEVTSFFMRILLPLARAGEYITPWSVGCSLSSAVLFFVAFYCFAQSLSKKARDAFVPFVFFPLSAFFVCQCMDSSLPQYPLLIVLIVGGIACLFSTLFGREKDEEMVHTFFDEVALLLALVGAFFVSFPQGIHALLVLLPPEFLLFSYKIVVWVVPVGAFVLCATVFCVVQLGISHLVVKTPRCSIITLSGGLCSILVALLVGSMGLHKQLPRFVMSGKFFFFKLACATGLLLLLAFAVRKIAQRLDTLSYLFMGGAACALLGMVMGSIDFLYGLILINFVGLALLLNAIFFLQENSSNSVQEDSLVAKKSFLLFLTTLIFILIPSVWVTGIPLMSCPAPLYLVAFFAALILYLIGAFFDELSFPDYKVILQRISISFFAVFVFFLSTKKGLQFFAHELTKRAFFFTSEGFVSFVPFVVMGLFLSCYLLRKKVLSFYTIGSGVAILASGVAFLIPAQCVLFDGNVLTSVGFFWSVFFNILIIFILCGLILYGYKKRSLAFINAGTALLFVLIIIKMFSFFSALNKTVFFTVSGLTLLLVGYGMERSRLYLTASLSKNEKDTQ